APSARRAPRRRARPACRCTRALRADRPARARAPHSTPAPRAADRGLQRRAGSDSPPRAARLVPQLPAPRPRGDAGTVARGAPALAGARARALVPTARAARRVDLPDPRHLDAPRDDGRGPEPVGAPAVRLVPGTLVAVLQRLLFRPGALAGVRGGPVRSEHRREGQLRALAGDVIRHGRVSLTTFLAWRAPCRGEAPR